MNTFECIESPATKPNKKAKISNTELDDDIAILLARGLTLRQVYEQLGLHESNMYLPDDNDARHDATISCDSSCTGTTTITSQSSFSTLTMSLDSADFYPSKPNTAVEYYGNPLRRGELRHGNPRRRRSHHHYHARDEVSVDCQASRSDHPLCNNTILYYSCYQPKRLTRSRS